MLYGYSDANKPLMKTLDHVFVICVGKYYKYYFNKQIKDSNNG